MSGKVLPWPRRASPSSGWTSQELAELYRVKDSLLQAGVVVETDCGISDEGDPWFVFCRADGHVVVHAARIDGLYLLHCASLPAPLTGQSFGEIAKTFVAMIGKTQTAGVSGRVVAHPSALLSLLVAAAVLSVDAVLHKSAEASELAPSPRNHFSAPDAAPKAAKVSIAKELADIFYSAVWRNSEGWGEREAVWQAVENAAVGLSALSGALPSADLSIESSGAGLIQGVRPVPDGAETADKLSDHPVDAGSVPVLTGAVAEVAIGRNPALSSLAPTPLHPAIDAPKFPGLWEAVLSEEGAAGSTSGGMPAFRGPREVGGLSSPQDKPFISSAELLPNPVDGARLDIALTSGGETIDLGGYATESVRIILSGGGALTVTHAAAAQSIEVDSGVKADLTLSYDEQPSAASIHQTLKLDGATDVSVKLASTPNAAAAGPTVDGTAPPPVNLVVDSQGAGANTLNFVDSGQGPPPELNLTVTGVQDLALNESAALAISSRLDASSLIGKLQLGIDLQDASAALHNLSLGSENFVVTPQDSVAFQNLTGGAQFELGVDLNTVVFGYDSHSAVGGPIALSIDLGSPGAASTPVKIGAIDAFEVTDLSITSHNGNNVVGSLVDPALIHLTLSGSSPIEIGSILGITANSAQNIVIDAGTLAGNLILNASAIADTGAGGRQVEITTGTGQSTVSDLNPTESLSLTIGSGPAQISVASGAEQIAFSGLKGTDQVKVGSAGVVDLFTNALVVLQPHQTDIDAAVTLQDAAAVAAKFAEPDAAHQALLFCYRGNGYVFVDALGHHVFDSSADAIVKVVGVTSSTDFSGVFHST